MLESFVKHRIAIACGILAALAVAAVVVCIALARPGDGGAGLVAEADSAGHAASEGADAPDGSRDPGGSDGDAGVLPPDDGSGASDSGTGGSGYVEPEQSEPARTPDGTAVPEEMVPEVTAEHQDGVVLVSLAPGYTAAELTEAINASGCTKPAEITEADVEAGFVTLDVSNDYDVAHAMTQLGMLPQTEGAQPNFIYHLLDDIAGNGASDLKDNIRDRMEFALTESANEPEKSLLAETAAVEINDPEKSLQWSLSAIHAYEAWAHSTSDKKVAVAIVDSGCLLAHEDLAANIIAAHDATGESGMNDVANHGTHVAGIVAAVANNGKGIAGVSYNAGLVPIQVFEWSEEEKGYIANTRSLVAAYNYIFDNPALNIRVVNMSLGGTIEGATEASQSLLDPMDKLFVNAVNKAYAKNILTVCSAGNDANTIGGAYINFPSDWLDNALGVIALQNSSGSYSRASYSNYNMSGQTAKDIAAPGSSIYSTVTASPTSYGYKSGTSMASPCVAGAAALVFSANPDLSAADVADILCQTAADLGDSGWDKEYGYGMVNEFAAVTCALGEPYLRGDTEVLVNGSTVLTPCAYTNSEVDGAWVWSSSDTSIAKVDSGGTVTGVSGGSVVITASFNGVSVSKQLIVYDASFVGERSIEYGSTATVSFSSVPIQGVWELGTSDSSVLAINGSRDNSLLVLGASKGTAKLTARLLANPKLVVEQEIAVAPAPISKASIGRIADQAYTGNVIKPAVAASFSSKKLVEGIDYTLSYKNNTAVGTATVTVTGKGNFTGSVSKTFSIVKANVSTASVSGVAASYGYTGGAIAPSPTVKVGSRTLSKGTDYTVSYMSNVNAGTATLTVTGKGNYTGTKAVSFKIAQASIASAAVSGVPSWAYRTGKAIAPGVTVKLGSKTLGNGSEYTVSYANNVNVGTATVTVSGKGNYAGSVKKTFRIIAAPSYSGATSMPVGSMAAWSLSNCSMRLASGSGVVSLSGSTVKALKAGKATLAFYNAAGAQVATKTVTVYAFSGAYTMKSAVNGGFVLDVSGGSTANGGNLQLYRSNGTNAQKFRFSYNSDGCYTITNAKSGKVVDVSGGSKARGANVQVWASNSTAAQRWRVTVDASNRLTFLNKGSGKALDLSGGVAANGRNVQQWDPNNANAQKWTLASVGVDLGAVYEGTYRIAPSLNTSFALDVSGGSRANGGNVQVWRSNGTNAQKWNVVYVGKGLYRVMSVGSGRALDVSGGSWGNGANVQQWGWNGSNAQLWKIARNSDGTYTFYRNGSNRVLDVSGGIAVNGRNVHQWTSNGTKAQKFYLYQY